MRKLVAAAAVVIFATAVGLGRTSQIPKPEPTVITDSGCAIGWTSCDPGRMAAEAEVQAACDLSRHFQGVKFEGPHQLSTTWLRVGRRLGEMLIVTDCQARWRGPDAPPYAVGQTHRIYRLVGISPRVALSLGGSSRRILLANSLLASRVCESAPGRDAALVRCLRRASR